MNLNKLDLNWCVRKLPSSLRKLMKREPIVVAGGYIRSCITGDRINDIDVFCSSKELAMKCALELAGNIPNNIIKSKNALTVKGIKPTVQFITRWTFSENIHIIKSFDWTICQAAFWWWGDFTHPTEVGRWMGICSEEFYPDLAAMRLIYTHPIRNEASGGSVLRVLKYYQRGYRITLDSFAAVMARVCIGVDANIFEAKDEPRLKMVLKGLLEEVDPTVDPDHILSDEEPEDEEDVN